MSKKLNILEEWKEQIDVFPKLNIEEAKALYIEASTEVEKTKRQDKFNSLIEGTLYLIYNFVKRNKLDNVNSSSFDIGDLISICNEIWIKELYSGEILNVDSFSKIIDRSFCSKVVEALRDTDFSASDVTILNANEFGDVLYEYIKYTSELGYVDYKKFFQVIDEHIVYYQQYYGFTSRTNQHNFSNLDLVGQTYLIFESIVNSIKDENDDINLTRTKLDKFKNLLLDVGMQKLRVDDESVYETDFSDRLVDTIVRNDFARAVMNSKYLDDRKKDVIVRLYGIFNQARESRESVAKRYNVTEARLAQIHNKAIAKLALDPEVRKNRNFK